MAKYRTLNLEELESLKAEFIRFLAAQSIPADDWVKIIETDKEREQELIDQFSDVVIEKSLFNTKYLEQRTAKRVLCYHVEEQSIKVIGLELGQEESFDFTTEFPLSDLVTLFEDTNVDISFILGNKKTEDVSMEIFHLIEEGAMISQGSELYDFLHTLKQHFSTE